MIFIKLNSKEYYHEKSKVICMFNGPSDHSQNYLLLFVQDCR